MIYTAILQDGHGNTTVFTFHGTPDRAQAFKDFDEAWPSDGFMDHYVLIAVVPGVQEIICRDGTHTLPRKELTSLDQLTKL